MIKQQNFAIGFWFFLSLTPCLQAQAGIPAKLIPTNASNGQFSALRTLELEAISEISIKIEKKIYDEKKDPALRKGTENWEEPQSSFFVIPALILGIAVIALFFKQK